MAVCSLLGGMALANAKLGAVHGFAGVLGGAAGRAARAGLRRPAGAGRRGQRARPAASGRREPTQALIRYADAARAAHRTADATVEDGVAWIRETLALLDVPGLAAYGLRAREDTAG